MGAWGTAAWDNDSAADYYAELFEKTALADHLAETLALDAEDYHEEIRAAAYLLIALGRVYIYPIEQLAEHLALALQRLREIRELEDYQEVPEFVDAIDEEIAVLRSRLASMAGPDSNVADADAGELDD